MVYHFYIDLKFHVLGHIIRMLAILKFNSRSSWVTQGQLAYHCCMDLDSVDGDTLYHRSLYVKCLPLLCCDFANKLENRESREPPCTGER